MGRRLAIDIDGVVADFVAAVEAWVKQNYGYDPVPCTHWDWYRQWPDGDMVWRHLWNHGVREEGLFLSCPPVDGALDALNRLQGHGHRIALVTHRPEDMHGDTEAWLAHYGLDMPVLYPDHSHNKASVAADFWLDDKEETVASLVEKGKNAYLFRQPWNETSWEELPSVSKWTEFEWLVADPQFEAEGNWG